MRYKIVLEPATRVSFDFDDTLSTERGQQLALDEMNKGNQVWIITARQDKDSEEVFAVADKLGIQHQHVIFTNGEDKWKYMIRHRIAKHYDNNKEQVQKINERTDTQAILF